MVVDVFIGYTRKVSCWVEALTCDAFLFPNGENPKGRSRAKLVVLAHGPAQMWPPYSYRYGKQQQQYAHIAQRNHGFEDTIIVSSCEFLVTGCELEIDPL